MFYKKNKSLFFDFVKNYQIFPSNDFHFRYDHSLLFRREMETLEVARRYDWKNLNLGCQDSIRFRILQVA